MILAVKCAPEESVLSDVCKAGLEAVELYLSEELLSDTSRVIQVCGDFRFRYAVHATNDGSAVDELVELTKRVNAEIVIFHDNYWEDEWADVVERFKGLPARLCIENVHSIHEPVKFMRRYGMGRCLDLEHLQIQCAGVYEEAFITLIEEASHIHLSGYRHGSSLWHTHIHHSPEHNMYILGLLKKANYPGFVVSEADSPLQTYAEFKRLHDFYENWKNTKVEKMA